MAETLRPPGKTMTHFFISDSAIGWNSTGASSPQTAPRARDRLSPFPFPSHRAGNILPAAPPPVLKSPALKSPGPKPCSGNAWLYFPATRPRRYTLNAARKFQRPESYGMIASPGQGRPKDEPRETRPRIRSTNGRWIRPRSRVCRSPRLRWSPPAPIAGRRSLPPPISACFGCEYGNSPSPAREIAHGSTHS